jgi:tRNA (adenine37-N6)-methyltransferase
LVVVPNTRHRTCRSTFRKTYPCKTPRPLPAGGEGEQNVCTTIDRSTASGSPLSARGEGGWGGEVDVEPCPLAMHLTLTPIGTIATPYTDRYRAPRQPGAALVPAEGIITLEPGMNFEQALEDIEGFERIWVIYWFDRNPGWKPKVLPPRGERVRRGVFATRSPHRPNPIGLSLLRLLEVRGRTLRVGDVDLLDGTPILDIKPYLPYAEAWPDARMGWLDEVVRAEREQDASRHAVVWSELAQRQVEWLASEHGIHLHDHAEAVLSADASPHPYRRISERSDGTLELAIKSWRIVFIPSGDGILVERIESGYAKERADEAAPGSLHDHAAHVGFHGMWSR